MIKYPIRISVFEDNNSLRQSLEKLFLSENSFLLKAVFPDCSDISRHMKDVMPDMVLMDIDMPGINGIEGVRQALDVAPDTIIVMFTVFDDDDKIFEALEAGAKGYLLKKTTNEKLVSILKDIYEGGTYMSPGIAQKVLARFAPPPKINIKDKYNLTARESDILKLLVEGYSYKMIAAHCSISIDTVRTHIKKIYEKLQVNSNVEAVRKANGGS